MHDVELEIGTTTVRVGDESFAGGLTDGGAVELAGLRVRPVTLDERERVVDQVAGAPDAAERCARLIGELASGGSAGELEAVRAAVEALALHLAGASRTGALVVSAVVARRSLGAEAGVLAAVDADRLAEALVPPLMTRSGRTGGRAPQPDEAPAAAPGGWTTITYAADPEPRPRARPGAAHDVRDRLAVALLARADAAVSAALARWLVGATSNDRPGTGDEPAARGAARTAARGSSGRAIEPASTSPTGWVSSGTADRWGSWMATAGTRTDRPVGQSSAVKLPVRPAGVDGPGPAAPISGEADVEVGAAGAAHDTGAARTGVRPMEPVVPMKPVGPMPPHSRLHPIDQWSTEAWRPRPASEARVPAGAEWSPFASTDGWSGGRPADEGSARHGGTDPVGGPALANVVVGGASADRPTGSGVPETERLAAALHRAADARGVPR